jgi:hypothetical protein
LYDEFICYEYKEAKIIPIPALQIRKIGLYSPSQCKERKKGQK